MPLSRLLPQPMNKAERHGVDPVGIIQPEYGRQYEPASPETTENLAHFREQNVRRILLLLLECFTNSGRIIAGGDSRLGQFEDQASIRNPSQIKHFILSNIRPLTLDRLLSCGTLWL